MSLKGHKRTSQDVRAMSALPPKADIVRFERVRSHSLFASAGKPRRDPHCIARKLPPSRLSDIQECCLDLQRRLRNVALRPYHTCAQHGAPVRNILVKPEPFEGTRACCLPSQAHRCTVFLVLARTPPLLHACFSLAQHCRERQKLEKQQRSPRWHCSARSFASPSLDH